MRSGMNQQDIDRLISQYLQTTSIKEEEEYKLEKLSGGMVNYVFRASTSSGSVILKQYKPFLSSAPGIPLSCERYFVEKKFAESDEWRNRARWNS
jgi:hypothetical protein